MSDLAISLLVDRTELGLADLQLEDPGKYRVVALGPGSVSWIRNYGKSPLEHGGDLINATKDISTAPLTVRVYGSSATVLEARTATLLRAFEQFNYTISATINGVAWSWSCYPADYGVNGSGEFDGNYLRSQQQLYSFQIPRDPVPLAGSQ